MKQKIIEVVQMLVGVIFIVIAGLFSWCACVISSRADDKGRKDNVSNNTDNRNN